MKHVTKEAKDEAEVIEKTCRQRIKHRLEIPKCLRDF